MRVFVYEYLCSGATVDAPASLQSEGWAMLSAIVDDLARVPGVKASTLLAPRLAVSRPAWSDRVSISVSDSADEERTFRALAAGADWSLVIAPEFEDILATRCRWVEEEGGRLLGPSSAAVCLTADKLTLGRHWLAHGIPTPALVALPDAIASLPLSLPCVAKPRYGAGSQATYLLRQREDLARLDAWRRAEGWMGESILQEYAPGRPVSVAFLAGNGRLHALPAAEQHLSPDGRFHYQGGRLPLPGEVDQRARRLAERAVRTVEGLHGYFGVDLVLGDDDGSRDRVIEINPRLTTSYVGLRRLARFNLAAALLALATCTPPPGWSWQSEPVAFAANGRVLS